MKFPLKPRYLSALLAKMIPADQAFRPLDQGG